MVPEVKTHLEFHDLDIVKANVANQNDPANIVRSTFEKALTNNFKRSCHLGNISPTRRLIRKISIPKSEKELGPSFGVG
jgi:hypothetical protein